MKMWFIQYGLVFLFWVLAVLCAILITRHLQRREIKHVDRVNTAIGWATIVVCVAVAQIPYMIYDFAFVDRTFYLARVEEGHLVYAEGGYGFWAWETGRRVWVPKFGVWGEGTVTAVTENPKVRSIHYKIAVYIRNPEKYYLRDEERQKLYSLDSTASHFYMSEYSTPGKAEWARDDIGRIVSNLMYDFNNQYSRKLAEFYNPLDQKQNDAFKELIEPWMNERLADDGLQVSFNSFSVGYPG